MIDRLKFPLAVALIAFILVLLAIGAGWRLERGDGTLLRNVQFSAQRITPNADGDGDALVISYEISRNAVVSIYFEDDAGKRHYFRRDKDRGIGDYELFFSGIVDGYRLPDDLVEGQIVARVLQDGDYRWTIEATDHAGVMEQSSGDLTIAEADTALPELRGYQIFPQTFTPNRDGISDRVEIQFQLMKEADSRVYLLQPNGIEVPISELPRQVEPNAPGRHYFDYEGGVDNGETPPPDGVYPVYGFAQDAIGQKVVVSDTLEIKFGGVPRADIMVPSVGDQVAFSASSWQLCDTLFFTLTLENYGEAPIRTTGPPPKTVYDSDWNFNTLGWFTESGAWRVAIGYEDELRNYPYRWAVGDFEDLEEIDGHLYLMPGARAVIEGGIRLTGALGSRNPQILYAGLIHEDVEISQFNNRVDPRAIAIDLPDPDNIEPCPDREIPVKPEG